MAKMCSSLAKHVERAGVSLARCPFAMSPFDRASSPSGFDQTDPLAAAPQQALTHWRAAFDDRLEALERALRGPADTGELSALIMDFTRVAGEEAEAAARQATLDAQTSARQASQAVDRQDLDAAQVALAEARRQHNDARQALDATRRAQDETRRAYESAVRSLDDTQRALQEAHREAADARRLVADAESQARQADEERRELAGIQTQLQAQLDQARTQAQDAGAQITSLQEELAEARREVEARNRELQTFRRRLEQAVHDAEERSRAQEAERARLAQDVAEASVRTDAAVRDRDTVQEALARASSEIDQLRSQMEAAAARIIGLEQELRESSHVIETLRQAEQTAKLVTAEELVAASVDSVPCPPPALPPPPTADVVGAVAAIASPCAEERVQPGPSEATLWADAPGAPVGVADTIARERSSAESAVAIEATDQASAEDPPLSPESTGVFSTVADALRAWTTETDAPDGRVAAPTLSSASLSATPEVSAESASPEVPQYDIVRQTVRYDLAARRIDVMIDREPGNLVDLSSSGAQVVTSSMLKPGRQVRLTFPTAGPLAAARAKIVWSRLEPPTHGGGELQYRAGLTFQKIDVKTIERVLSVPPTIRS